MRIDYTDGYYEGEVKDDEPHGRGALYVYNKYKYFGNFKNGHMSGQGKLFLECGQYYEGEFFIDVFHGRGVYHYTTREKYDGEFTQ